MTLEMVCSLAQPVQILVAESKLNARVGLIEREGKINGLRILNLTGRRAKLLGNLAGADGFGAFFGRRKADEGLHLPADRDDRSVAHDTAFDIRVLLSRFGAGDLESALNLVTHLQEALERRAVRHLNVHADEVRLDLGHELEGHNACGLHRRGDGEQREEERHGRIAQPDGELEHRLVDIVGKPEQAVGDPALQGEEAAAASAEHLFAHMREVVRQDEH